MSCVFEGPGAGWSGGRDSSFNSFWMISKSRFKNQSLVSLLLFLRRSLGNSLSRLERCVTQLQFLHLQFLIPSRQPPSRQAAASQTLLLRQKQQLRHQSTPTPSLSIRPHKPALTPHPLCSLYSGHLKCHAIQPNPTHPIFWGKKGGGGEGLPTISI